MQFEGIYFKPKGYKGQLTYPKVVISPEGTFVATLDLTGLMQIFKLDKGSFTISRFVWEREMIHLCLIIYQKEGGNISWVLWILLGGLTISLLL